MNVPEVSELDEARSGVRQYDAEPGNPWEAQFSDPADIERVRWTLGRRFNRPLYWIPGIVLGVVSQPADFPETLGEIRAALGRDGMSTGLVLLLPGCPKPANLTREMLASGRIRVQAADAAALNEHIGDGEEFADSVARSTLRKLGKASAAWLKGREKQLAQASKVRRTG